VLTLFFFCVPKALTIELLLSKLPLPSTFFSSKESDSEVFSGGRSLFSMDGFVISPDAFKVELADGTDVIVEGTALRFLLESADWQHSLSFSSLRHGLSP
jgi:hypothetical protein